MSLLLLHRWKYSTWRLISLAPRYYCRLWTRPNATLLSEGITRTQWPSQQSITGRHRNLERRSSTEFPVIQIQFLLPELRVARLGPVAVRYALYSLTSESSISRLSVRLLNRRKFIQRQSRQFCVKLTVNWFVYGFAACRLPQQGARMVTSFPCSMQRGRDAVGFLCWSWDWRLATGGRAQALLCEVLVTLSWTSSRAYWHGDGRLLWLGPESISASRMSWLCRWF